MPKISLIALVIFYLNIQFIFFIIMSKTQEHLSKTIFNLTPDSVKYIYRNLQSCMSVYHKSLRTTSTILMKSFESWCEKLPLKLITDSIEKELFENEHAVIVGVLKMMLAAVNLTDLSVLTAVKIHARKWPQILLKSFSKGFLEKYLKSKMAYLTDLLAVSVKFSSMTDVKSLILEGVNLHGVANEKIGFKFCKFFMDVFFEFLIRKPFVLLDENMRECYILLSDVTKHAAKRRNTDEELINVLELVDKLWPIYSASTDFNDKYSLLLNLSSLPHKLGPESNPMQWAVNVIASDANREDKARLIVVLPGGESYKSAYRQYASTLPVRLSELNSTSNAALRALLDALAARADVELLHIVFALCTDPTKGWWEAAMDACCASLSQRVDLAALPAVGKIGVIPTTRLLVPLLRYSTPSTCERYFSSTLKDIMAKLNVKYAPSAHVKYKTCLESYTKAFILLKVAFEKVPPQSLESPSSLLYSAMAIDPPQPWWLIRRTCDRCVTLNKLDASDIYKETFRQMQCANYNCLCAAICRRAPVPHFYKHVFSERFWSSIIDQQREYLLPLTSKWEQRTKRHAVSIDVESEESRLSSSRTRVFLRTLSENPLLYDFVDEVDDDVSPQELQLTENELNSHECASTLTALVQHVAAQSKNNWREETSIGTLVETLANALCGGHPNSRFLLAQVICNCKEELKAHASLLRPALLALVADTLRIENGRKLLNGLHLDVIETLLHWPEESPSHSEHLDITVEALIGTCLQRPQSNYLTNTLGRVLDVYSCVNVRWKFDENPADPTKVYQLLIQISKRKIYIPELLPTLLGKLDSKQGMAKLSELFGLAVSCGHTDGQVLVKFRKLLERRREANIGEYLKMLYFAQMGCADCCDEYHFRKITDLVPKMPSAEKPKCLKILKSFVKSHRSEYIKDMYDTVSVSELLIGDHSVEAMGLVEVGLDQINEELKRRVINQIASYCSHSHVRVRKAACAVMVRAFDELYTPSLEPACKRQKTDSTPLIKTIKSRETDNYGYTVLTALSRCVLDKDGDISREARSCVAKRLSQDMDVRFTESFILTVYIPVICKNKCVSLSVCVTALLEMLLSELRADDRFLRVRLREEPLQLRSTRDFTKLRTMSTKYQGTLRGYTTLTGRRPRKVFLQDDNTPDIDVQVPIASVLDTILQFAKKTPAASIALCAQFAKSLPTLCSEFIPELLQTSELAPLVLELAMVFVDNCDLVSYNSTLASLMPTTRGTEAETSVDLLIQEINIRLKGSEQFVLGFHDECDDDWALCEDDAFRIEDLKAVFGKLSNWDLLTNQQKRKVKSDLPPLWAERGTFQACLNDHRGTDTWFDKMAAAYNHQYQDGMRCLRDMDKWPRRYFNISAVIEALEWQASPGDVPKLTNDMQPSDCMAEWAARFMIRSAYVACLSDSETENKAIVLSRSHELQWCERANEMALSNLVLGCVKRNSEDLYESETLPWLRQKVLALRNMGLERQNTELLAKALDTAEMYTPKFIEESCPKDVLLMDKLILLLHRDLQSLSKQKLQSVLKDVETQLTKTQFELQDKKTVESIYEISISHYDDLWENVTETKQEVLKDMIDVLGRAADLDLPRCSAFLDLILNRLEMYPEIMPENVAKKFLDNIQLLLPTLDEFALQELRKHKAMFPSHLLAQFEYMGDRDSDSLTKYTRCLQLINDPEYTLLQYVDLLDRSLKKYDSSEWEKIFSRISYKVFDNPYAGTDYQLLTKYKNKLYEIKDFERTESFKAKAETVIKEIKRELNQRREQNLGVFKLSQLCPTLSHDVGDTSLAKLLGLRGVHVVRFEEQIPVFTDSIRRPAVVTALLSTGRSSRYLHKSGEPLRADQAAQRVLAAAGEVWGADAVVGYHVTPLSDDCGLIEFLEDYERLRTLILQSCDLDSVLAKVSRPSDEELILSSTETSLALHRRLESLVPVNSLRNACRRGNRFTATFASMSMLTWILGLGDRHLNNILYSSTDDTVCCVDWASVLEYTAELPSARVTRCLLCACDVTGLESRLQTLLQSLRDTHKLFLATIKIAFKWMGADFEDKYPHIESILRGTSTSYDVSRQIISHSSIKYKDEYIQLLDDVFQEFPVKRQYTVEEQISIFLRQCTDPRILSVTREGWEPWV